MAVFKVCKICGKRFELGLNGIWQGRRYICDPCAGVERDTDGRAWEPGETEVTFVNVGDSLDKAYIVTRDQAFGRA